MSIGQNEEGKMGYVFPSEQKDGWYQSLIFAVPIIGSQPADLFFYLDSNTFYFPFAFGDKPMELEAKVAYPDMIFEVPDTDFKIAFEIRANGDQDPDFFSRSFYRPPRKVNQYVGNNSIPTNNGFFVLQPVDLLEMDELYWQHKGVFVGLTPAFGLQDEQQLAFN